MHPRSRNKLAIAFLCLFFGACADNRSDDPAGEPNVEVRPSTVLLTRVGESYSFKAQAFDASGNPLDADVTWESSSADVSVDASGQVTSEVTVGSAQLTAKFGDVVSKPATVIVAEPAAGAVLVSDAQVLELPVAVDPTAPPEIGTRYTVVLTDIQPPPEGTVLLAKEDAPIAGRVVSTESRGADVVVTLQAVPVTELVRNLDLSQAFPIGIDDFVIQEDPLTTVTEEADGSLTISYDAESDSSVQPALKQDSDSGPVKLGPFLCKTSLLPKLTFRGRPTLTFDPGIALDTALVISDSELQRLLIKLDGSLKLGFKLEASLTAAYKGSIKCRWEVVEVPIPAGGFLSAVFSTSIPLGIGLDMEGALELAQIKVGLDAGVNMVLTVGFEYTAIDGLTNLSGFEAPLTGGPILDFPKSLFEDIRVNGSLYGYVWSGFSLTVLPALEVISELTGLELKLETQLLDVTAGPRFGLSLALVTAQANDANYASKFDLQLFGKAGPSDEVKGYLQWFGKTVEAIPLEYVLESPLYRSPKGNLIANTLDVIVGVPIQFRVALEPDTVNFFTPLSPLLGKYSVGSVSIYKIDQGTFLTDDDLIATVQPNAIGQADFSATWTPSMTDEGLNTFAAFVTTDLVGFSFFPLEVADDSRLTINVRSQGEPSGDTFVLLGAFEGSNGLKQSRAAAINDQGLVAGESTGLPQGKAFRWQSGIGLVDLGSPPSEPQDSVNEALGINNLGHVVGTFRSTFSDGTVPKFMEEQPFVWKGGSMESLNETLDLEVWKQLKDATDINDGGTIVGWGQFIVGDSTRGRGYIYRDGEATQLSTLGVDTNFSRPKAINNFDQVVGVVTAPSGQDKVGFLWDESIQEIRPDGFPESEANDINDEGEIVGWAGQTNTVLSRAFVWLPVAAHGLPAGMSILEFPTCPANPSVGSAHAINNKGQVLASTQCGWVVWDQGDIIEIIPADNNLSIKVLTDINDNGQAVGYSNSPFGSDACNGTDCALLVNFEDLR